MAIVIEGYALVNGDSGDTGSTSITVPAGATFVVAFWDHWDGNARSLTSFTINSVAFTIHENQTSTSGGRVAMGVATLANPSTGSQTFAWDWNAVSGAVDQGGNIHLIFLSGQHATTPVSDTAVAGATSTTNPGPISITVTDANDLVLGAACNGNNANPGSGTDQSILNSWDGSQNGINFTDIFKEDTTDTPTTELSMTSPNYASICGIAIAQAAGEAPIPYVYLIPQRSYRHTGRFL